VLFDLVVALALVAGEEPEVLDDACVAADEAELWVAEAPPPVAVGLTAVDADLDLDLTAEVEAETATAEEEVVEPVPAKTSVAGLSEELTLSTQNPAPVFKESLKAPT